MPRTDDDAQLPEQWTAVLLEYLAIIGRVPVELELAISMDNLDCIAKTILPPSAAPDDGRVFFDTEAANLYITALLPSTMKILQITLDDGEADEQIRALVARALSLWRTICAPEDDRVGTSSKESGRDAEARVTTVSRVEEPELTTAELLRMVVLNASVRHQNIVRCYGASHVSLNRTYSELAVACEDPHSHAYDDLLVTYEKTSCNLSEAIRDGALTNTEERRSVVSDVAQAIGFLHKNNVVHGHIQPENVLVKLEENGQLPCAKLFNVGRPSRVRAEKLALLSDRGHATEEIHFTPPEVMEGAYHNLKSKASDVWSFGALLCFLFAGGEAPSNPRLSAQKSAEDVAWALRIQEWAWSIEIDRIREDALSCLRADPATRSQIHELSVFISGEGKADGPNNNADTRALRGAASQTVFDFGRRLELGSWVACSPSRATEMYELSANMGHLSATFQLGECYRNGVGVEDDAQRAAALYGAAATQGHMESLRNLGSCYAGGLGVEQDVGRAAELFSEAAEMGDTVAIFNLGHAALLGRGMEKDEVRAVALFEQATNADFGPAFSNLGLCYMEGIGVERDETRAFNLYLKAVDLGEDFALWNAGICYRHGKGVEKDAEAAASFFERTAAAGHTGALIDLAEMYEEDCGLGTDRARAAEAYQRAADEGNAEATFRLGDAYEKGDGVAKDLSRAAELYERAAGVGHWAATFRIGAAYSAGRGVERDDKLAVSLLQEAMEYRVIGSFGLLGEHYLYGRGVEKDMKRAVELFEEGFKAGDKKATSNLWLCRERGWVALAKNNSRSAQ